MIFFRAQTPTPADRNHSDEQFREFANRAPMRASWKALENLAAYFRPHRPIAAAEWWGKSSPANYRVSFFKLPRLNNCTRQNAGCALRM